ncbi:MAG: hypothetical protein KGI50_05530 [Patescibacteria group bacterium]|nr:hypothetical protein [Patescibacteria group bacterium]MDE2438906.1 hypothetical protein [Patescibacteria group bacterium]
MCEPYGSVVQYPRQDEEGNPVVAKIEAVVASQKIIVPEPIVIPQGISIGSHIHFAKLGNGHSETIGRVGLGRLRLPMDTKYEINWWQRAVTLDGKFHGQFYDAEDALDSCRIYAERLCLGHIQKLRQFLEVSLEKTETAGHLYLDRARRLFTRDGRIELEKKLKYIAGPKDASLLYDWADKRTLMQACRAILGLTRKRSLMNYEWSDVPELWT